MICLSQQLTNDQFYQRFGNHRAWAAGWGMWRIKKDNFSSPDPPADDFYPKILQMVELDIINNDYYYIMQDTIFGTHVGQDPLRDPCSGDSGRISTLLYTDGAIMVPLSTLKPHSSNMKV